MSCVCIDVTPASVIEVIDVITNITEINPQPISTIELEVGELTIDIFTPAPQPLEIVGAFTEVIEIVGVDNSFIPVLEINTSIVPVVGPPGPPGLSAYELAVQDGFVGTLEQWFLSIIAINFNEVLVSPATNTHTVNHNFGFKPDVQVLDLFGNEIECCIQHTSDNQFIINLSTNKEFRIIYR